MPYIVIRHNMPWVTKVHSVSVEMFGLTDSLEEAKKKALEAVNAMIDENNEGLLDDDYEPHLTDLDFETSVDGCTTLLFENLEMAYDIIVCNSSFEHYTSLIC